MSFSAIQLKFLHRLVSDRPARRDVGATATYFSEHFSIGIAIGGHVEYRDEHFEVARRLLHAHDLPASSLGPDATRADAAAYGGMSEKNLSASPHAGSVAVKSLGTCTLDGHTLYAPEGAYLVLTPAQARRVTCERIMVVENLETFRGLEAYAWIDRQGLDVLVVYRGDPKLPNKDATEVVLSRPEPIWSFFDFDPAGLLLANSLPDSRLEQVVLPPFEWLRQAADSQRGRQLFDSQSASFGQALEQARHPTIRALWSIMKELTSAVTQERMRNIDAKVPR